MKIAIIGAWNVEFTRGIYSDLLCVPEFRDTEFVFTDLNAHNLDMVYQLCRRDVEAAGFPATIRATTDRREAFRDANYVLFVGRVGGLEAFQRDIEVPMRYGVAQCVGDTLGPGGIMYAQRTIHQLLAYCQDIREVAAPGCLLLNHAKPMAMNTWACNKYGGVRTIGLCHSVQGSYRQVAWALGYPPHDVDVICAGINHQNWFISIKHHGEELAGKLLAAFEKDPEFC